MEKTGTNSLQKSQYFDETVAYKIGLHKSTMEFSQVRRVSLFCILSINAFNIKRLHKMQLPFSCLMLAAVADLVTCLPSTSSQVDAAALNLTGNRNTPTDDITTSLPRRRLPKIIVKRGTGVTSTCRQVNRLIRSTHVSTII